MVPVLKTSKVQKQRQHTSHITGSENVRLRWVHSKNSVHMHIFHRTRTIEYFIICFRTDNIWHVYVHDVRCTCVSIIKVRHSFCKDKIAFPRTHPIVRKECYDDSSLTSTLQIPHISQCSIYFIHVAIETKICLRCACAVKW